MTKLFEFPSSCELVEFVTLPPAGVRNVAISVSVCPGGGVARIFVRGITLPFSSFTFLSFLPFPPFSFFPSSFLRRKVPP